ncbi:MAG: winged helix-turn-helix transcriptional regulator [Myxococcales bacterium]
MSRGLPGMSRSLLTQRLRMLEDRGVIESAPNPGRRGRTYVPTDAGRALWPVIEALSSWGQEWIELQPEHSDPSFVLWAWAHVHLRRDRLPARRVVVEFQFPEQPPQYRRFWFLVEGGELELCYVDPGFEPDLHVEARSVAFTHWHVGRLPWATALRSGEIRVQGPRALARALPSWNEHATA